MEGHPFCHLDLFDAIPKRSYSQNPFGRFRSFSWEFACIVSTRMMYINGLTKGVLDGSTPQGAGESAYESMSKKEIRVLLDKTFKSLSAIITNPQITAITFFREPTDKSFVLSFLFQHEQLHLGKFMLYFAKAGFPQSKKLMAMWGKQSFQRPN